MSEAGIGYKKFIRFLIGVFVLLAGVTMILAWWPDVVSLFRGFLGIVLAIAGLLVLYSVSK
jgi:hypothetical protein